MVLLRLRAGQFDPGQDPNAQHRPGGLLLLQRQVAAGLRAAGRGVHRQLNSGGMYERRVRKASQLFGRSVYLGCTPPRG